MVVTPELLGSFPALKPLSADVLTELAPQCALHKFARRAIVLHAGKPEDSLWFLFDGRLPGVDFTLDGL